MPTSSRIAAKQPIGAFVLIALLACLPVRAQGDSAPNGVSIQSGIASGIKPATPAGSVESESVPLEAAKPLAVAFTGDAVTGTTRAALHPGVQDAHFAADLKDWMAKDWLLLSLGTFLIAAISHRRIDTRN